MQWPDAVNGTFEFGIGVLALKNVQALARDQVVKGVHWGVTAWAGLWGIWNLYYYPHLGQWLSFAGGLTIVSINLLWLAMVFYYWRKARVGMPI